MNLGGGAIPSGLAAVLFATVSIFIVGLSVPVLGAAISRRQAGGVGVALAALAALIAHQAVAVASGERALHGTSLAQLVRSRWRSRCALRRGGDGRASRRRTRWRRP